jgi:hypothetical protein
MGKAVRDQAEAKSHRSMRFKLAERLSTMLGAYVDPCDIEVWPAVGYWTHMHQDCMRWTGRFPRPELPSISYSLGSWSPMSAMDRKGFVVYDERAAFRADADFMVELP